MKIVIQPTTDEYDQHTVTVETPRDDLDIFSVGVLLKAALQAYGFAEATVDELLGTDEISPADADHLDDTSCLN